MKVRRYSLLLLCVVLLLLGVRVAVVRVPSVAARPAEHPSRVDAAASVQAFEAIVPTLHNPRCMNCHMIGDHPRQGDDSHPHIMQVRRGPSGHGEAPVYCSTCHQDHNLAGVHMPPGAPDWALPPPAMPMIWQDLSERQLCLLLKDPNQNGHRTVSQIVEHMSTPLVRWGWHPGPGRKPIPMPEEAFEHDVALWAAGGAVCPAK